MRRQEQGCLRAPPATRLLMTITALIGALNVAHSQSPPRPSTLSAERIVAEFYAWYVPMARSDKGPHLRALQERRAQFSDLLVKALRAEAAATAEGGEEIDGLDADPLLNAQEPCEHYRPVRTTLRGDEFLVEFSAQVIARRTRSPTSSYKWPGARIGRCSSTFCTRAGLETICCHC